MRKLDIQEVLSKVKGAVRRTEADKCRIMQDVMNQGITGISVILGTCKTMEPVPGSRRQ